MVSNDVFFIKISKEYVVSNMLDLRCAKIKIGHRNWKKWNPVYCWQWLLEEDMNTNKFVFRKKIIY